MKTLGLVSQEASPLNFMNAESWQAVADAVVSEYEARRWRPIDTMPAEKLCIIIGYRCKGLGWLQTFWWTGTEFTPPVELTHWTPAPAPPKEVG